MNHSKIIFLFLFILSGQFSYSQGKSTSSAHSDTLSVSHPEVLPSFPGGEMKLMEFIASNIHYPEKAKRKGNVGTAYLSFIVKESGEVTAIKTQKGIPGCKSCDEEAMRVVAAMPKWSPALKAGKAVAVQYILPVKFSLK